MRFDPRARMSACSGGTSLRIKAASTWMSGASLILSLRSSGGSIGYSFRTELVGEGGVKEVMEDV